MAPVSDLTTEAFIATLRRLISQCGKPSVIWSDHGTNFVGAATELKDLFHLIIVSNSYYSSALIQNMQWDFIPERAPHFGGLWEAAVKSFKSHLNINTFEELTTILEACLNGQPLTRINCNDDGIAALKGNYHVFLGYFFYWLNMIA